MVSEVIGSLNLVLLHETTLILIVIEAALNLQASVSLYKRGYLLLFINLKKVDENYHTFTSSPSCYFPAVKRNVNPVALISK